MINNSKNALSLLSVYETDSESDDELNSMHRKRKFVTSSSDDNRNKFLKITENHKLPSPSFLPINNEEILQNENHDGRIRSFAHERGNWATYVYIPYENNSVLHDLIQELTECSESVVKLNVSEELHISLTKTLILRHHWIDSFISTLTNYVSHIGPFVLFFNNFEVYCNEERTRTFLGLCTKTGQDTLINIVNSLDKGLKEFNLPTFYENPSFHMTLAWTVGDHEESYRSLLTNFNDLLTKYMSIYPQSYWYIHVNNLLCKIGNKMYNLNLSKNFMSE